MKEDKRADHNLCRYCNRILFGVSACECSERMENEKLWKKHPKNSNKSKKV